jgi:hypothetical protein
MTLVRAVAWAFAACAVGCGAGAPAPVIHTFAPARGYSDRALRVFIHGEGFLPAFEIDPSRGRRGDVSGFSGRVGEGEGTVTLRDFDWISVDELSAWMDPGLPVGVHDVTVIDPRGEHARLPQAFLALGPDRDKPRVQFVQPAPGSPAAAGIPLRAKVVATDREPGRLADLRWELHSNGIVLSSESCSLGSDPTAVTCEFQVVVPPGLAAGNNIDLTALASDEAVPPNMTPETLSFELLPPPLAMSVSPERGGTEGGTDVVIRGSGFPPGSRVLVDGTPLEPRATAGVRLDGETLAGRMPKHAEGTVSVVVQTPIGESVLRDAFTFEAPPKINDISPESGNPSGGTMVRIRGERFTQETKVYFGDPLPAAVPLGGQKNVSQGEITGYAPPAPPGQGRASVWAVDPERGVSQFSSFGWSPP